MTDVPYHNYSTLSNPVLLTVVWYCDTVLPLPCDSLVTCHASFSPFACWDTASWNYKQHKLVQKMHVWMRKSPKCSSELMLIMNVFANHRCAETLCRYVATLHWFTMLCASCRHDKTRLGFKISGFVSTNTTVDVAKTPIFSPHKLSWRWPNFESKISSFVVTKSAEVSRDLGKSPGFVATSAAAYDLTPCCKYQVFVAINGWKLSIPSTPRYISRDMHKRERMVCRNVNRQHFILATGAKNATFDSWCFILVWY